MVVSKKKKTIAIRFQNQTSKGLCYWFIQTREKLTRNTNLSYKTEEIRSQRSKREIRISILVDG